MRERKCGLLMHAPLLIALLSLWFSFYSIFLFVFVSPCSLFSLLPFAFLPPPLLFMATPFYTICHFGIYPFCPSTVFGFLWASLQDYPLTYQLSNHYLCLECVGCITPHFQTKLLALFLTSLCFCFTSIDKD